MPLSRKDTAMGACVGFVRVILYFSLVLLILGVITFPFVSPASAEYVIIIMAIGVSAVTAIAAWIYVRVASKKEEK